MRHTAAYLGTDAVAWGPKGRASLCVWAGEQAIADRRYALPGLRMECRPALHSQHESIKEGRHFINGPQTADYLSWQNTYSPRMRK